MGLQQKVEENLRQVLDPGTGMDVMSMKLVRDLKVEESGTVKLTFRPSSLLCPLGFQLGISIKEAIQAVSGVSSVEVNVDGFAHAEQLKKILAELDGC
ncbi:MAG: metal-sulfur cluster assembly factor [Syntrophobacteria bacterium]